MATLKVPLSPEELAAPKSKVCVTGAAGYIASYIVQRLLAAGHTGAGAGTACPRDRGRCSGVA
jgi:NAD(P)-dependent dehydrogenase (short-subunit alcohol dehydrogenase family)